MPKMEEIQKIVKKLFHQQKSVAGGSVSGGGIGTSTKT